MSQFFGRSFSILRETRFIVRLPDLLLLFTLGRLQGSQNWRQKRHSQCLKCACSGDRTNGALHPCPHDDMTTLTMVCKPYTLTVFLSLCCQQNKVKNPSSYATLSSPVKWRERSEARYATIRATGLGAADRMVRIFLRVTGGSVGRHGARTQSRPIRRTI